MALFQGSIHSKCLGMATQLTVFLPGDRSDPGDPPARLLYLLHGLTDGAASWLTGTALCRYAQRHNLAVIMPEGHRSFYLDIPHGPRYFSYVSQELPTLAARLFRLEQSPRHTYIAGNSMGGHGALKCFFANPGQYAGCAAFSPVVSLEPTARLLGLRGTEYDLRGAAPDGPPWPPVFDLRHYAAGWQGPPPDICIGDEDFLLEQNLEFHQWMEDQGILHRFGTAPGSHDWDFWDRQLESILDRWFPDP